MKHLFSLLLVVILITGATTADAQGESGSLITPEAPLSICDTGGEMYIAGVRIGMNQVQEISEQLSVPDAVTLQFFNNQNGVITGADLIGTAGAVKASAEAGSERLPFVVIGDVTGSGTATINDLVHIARDLTGADTLSGLYRLAADFNGNGEIDLADLVMEARLLTAPRPFEPSPSYLLQAAQCFSDLGLIFGTGQLYKTGDEIPVVVMVQGIDSWQRRYVIGESSGEAPAADIYLGRADSELQPVSEKEASDNDYYVYSADGMKQILISLFGSQAQSVRLEKYFPSSDTHPSYRGMLCTDGRIYIIRRNYSSVSPLDRPAENNTYWFTNTASEPVPETAYDAMTVTEDAGSVFGFHITAFNVYASAAEAS